MRKSRKNEDNEGYLSACFMTSDSLFTCGGATGLFFFSYLTVRAHKRDLPERYVACREGLACPLRTVVRMQNHPIREARICAEGPESHNPHGAFVQAGNPLVLIISIHRVMDITDECAVRLERFF